MDKHEDAVPPPENYNVQDYTDVITRMYAGSRKEVILRCCTTVIDQVIDKFGKDVHPSNINPYTFDATVTAAVSGTSFPGCFNMPGRSPSCPRSRSGRCMRTCSARPWKVWIIQPYAGSRNPGTWSGNCKIRSDHPCVTVLERGTEGRPFLFRFERFIYFRIQSISSITAINRMPRATNAPTEVFSCFGLPALSRKTIS